MSRAKHIKARFQAKKRKVMMMRGGITAIALCAATFFIFMPEATSGTGGIAERETPEIPLEEPTLDVKTQETDIPKLTNVDSLAQNDKPEPKVDSLKQVAEASIETSPSLPETQTIPSNPDSDVEGGSRSPERDKTNTNTSQPQQSSVPNVQFSSPEAVLGAPTTETKKVPEVVAPTYMKIPDYESATLKYKLGLIGSDAYSPSDKERLHKHIVGLFANPNAQVEAVYLEAGGQKFTKSYPIRLYLLRLEQNPSIRVRSLEKVQEGGRLSALIVKE
ncbi:MAG: hypothetical protein AB8H47_09605 [Bacteroidia bacterium]